MAIHIEELVDSIINQQPDAEESALALGLLIERECVRRPDPTDDGGIRKILSEEYINRRLSKQEIDWCVNRLLDHLANAREPTAAAVWPIVRSYQVRVTPTLIRLLKSTVSDPSHEHLALACLD